MEQVDDPAQRGPVRHGHVAVSAVLLRDRVEPVELAAVLLPGEGGHHLVHEVVDVHELELRRTVVDLYGEAVRDVVAERRHGRVVVRAAPFPEQVRETVDKDPGPSLLCVAEEQLLSRQLRLPVVGGAVAAHQGRLDGAGQHHGALVAVLLQCVEQHGREAEVPLHELRLVLGPVDPRQVEHEVRFPAVGVKFGGVAVDVVFIDRQIAGHGVPARLSVPYVVELGHQVLTDKALGSGNQYIHQDCLFFVGCADSGTLSAGILPPRSVRAPAAWRRCSVVVLFRPDLARLRPGDEAEVLLYEAQAHELLLHALHVQAPGVVAVVVLNAGDVLAAVLEELVVVQVTRVAGNPVVAAHVYRARHLLPRDEGLVELLAVPGADDLHLRLAVLRVDLGVYLLQRLRQRGQGRRRGLLHEQVAVVAVLERVYDQVDGVVERHHEARHVGVGYSDGPALGHLLHPQRDDGAAAGHHVAVARAADGRGGVLAELAPLRYRHLLHQGLRDAHRVDGVRRLVGREHHHVLHPVLDGGLQHVLRAQDVGARRLQREELARGHLLQRRSGEHVVHAVHRDVDRVLVAHVADVELHLRVLQRVPHVVLLLLVAREDPYLPDVRVQETAQHRVAETARAPGDEEGFVFED